MDYTKKPPRGELCEISRCYLLHELVFSMVLIICSERIHETMLFKRALLCKEAHSFFCFMLPLSLPFSFHSVHIAMLVCTGPKCTQPRHFYVGSISTFQCKLVLSCSALLVVYRLMFIIQVIRLNYFIVL